MELIIVRHGETDANAAGRFLGITDPHLNEKGIIQAYTAAGKLAGEKVAGIFSSPLKRAAQTAGIIREALGCGQIEYSDDIRERSFGAWDGLSRDEVMQRYPEAYGLWLIDAAYLIEDAERPEEVKSRIERFLKTLCGCPPDRVYILVTHLGCIRYMLTHLLTLPDEYTWRFRADPGSLTRVQINYEGYAYLTMLNG